MTQEEIKNMGELYRSVIEGKSKVEEACSKKKMEETDPVDKKELKKDFKDRDDKDIDNDGDVDDSDEYLVKKRKAISKDMKEGSEAELADTLMNVVVEASAPEEMDSKDSENAKKFKKMSGKGSEEVLDGEAIEGDKENGKPKNGEAKSRKGDNKNVKEFFSFLDSIDEAKMKEKDDSENTEKDSDGGEDISLLIKKNAEKRQDAEDGEEDKESKRDKKKDVKEDVELEEAMRVNTQAICKEAGKLSPSGQAKVFSFVLDLQDKEGIS